MSHFNNPNLFHFNYNLIGKNNLIKVTKNSWKQYIFNYNLIEKALAKKNFLVLRSFFNQQLKHYYFLLYRAKSHKIFKRTKKKYKSFSRLIDYHQNIQLKPKILKKMLFSFKKFLNLGHLTFKIYSYCLFWQLSSNQLFLFSNKKKILSKFIFFFLIFRFFLNWTNMKLFYLHNLILFKKKWKLFTFKVKLFWFFFGIFYNQLLLLRFSTFFSLQSYFLENLSSSILYNYYFFTFFFIKIYYFCYFLWWLNFKFWYYLKKFKIKLKKNLLFLTKKKNNKLLTNNKLWKLNLQNNLSNFIKKSLNFTLFFWNKRDQYQYREFYGGYTLPKDLLILLKNCYKNIDFIKQRKFFFFKDTLYLLFLSIFYVNPRIFTKHLSRLFMLIRRHRDLFRIIEWILTSPVIIKWMQQRLLSFHLVIKGRIENSDRAITKNFGFGRIWRQTFFTYLLYSFSFARTWYGSYSIKIWILYNEKTIS